jgi:DNA-binding transcriptional MerR regulator
VSEEPRYAIGDLADLGGVSRRTVRYYVQEGLLPAPLGVGRGNHYGPAHLDRLLKVRALQESGRTLDEIRQTVHQRSRGAEQPELVAPPERAIWRRITLGPGLELNVAGDVRLPSPGKLSELAAWCRANFSVSRGDDYDA